MKTAFSLLIALLLIAPLFAWEDCPFGQVNDTYPGDCGRYVDTDWDGVCDHSETAPSDRQAAVAPVAAAAPANEDDVSSANANKGEIWVKRMVNPNYDVLGVAALTIVLYAASYFLA